MLKKTKVIEVKEASPAGDPLNKQGVTRLHGHGVNVELSNPVICQGIRDKVAAENWALKNNHAVVYYIAQKQKVYAERQKVQIAQPGGHPQKVIEAATA